ncbi:DUF4236 domain-containing protein [Dyella silvatica]|uniref:DUF4236 domain-containing protein n=1 Tax=Dyella silvatica TaxID=2992128 RepID=UPI002258FD58|nr:DUF4236 domain-containing protein [Dyella silvatica]
MSFYLRKSVSVGPLRFNLSQGGVGVSVGIPGFRIGTGPRGNYVHMGRAGVYYRATLPAAGNSRRNAISRGASVQEAEIPDGTHAPLTEIDSADASTIVDSSSQELLDEIKVKRARVRLMPATALTGGLASWLAWSNQVSLALVYTLVAATVILGVLAHTRDVLKKTVVLFYVFDSEMERAYGFLHRAGQSLSSAAGAWHIEAQGAVYDGRYHAGAGSLIKRRSTKIARAMPPGIKTNVETISIDVGRQTLHFLPDRVLVYQGSSVGAVGYRELQARYKSTNFIEDGSPPSDARVVGHTWRFVNKNGSPDRRFNNNRQLPICEYDEVTFTSPSGLNEMIQVSHAGTGDAFVNSIHLLARMLPRGAT